MDAGKIAAISAGVISFTVIGGLLLLNRTYLFGYQNTWPIGMVSSPATLDASNGGKRRRTQRKKKGRK